MTADGRAWPPASLGSFTPGHQVEPCDFAMGERQPPKARIGRCPCFGLLLAALGLRALEIPNADGIRFRNVR